VRAAAEFRHRLDDRTACCGEIRRGHAEANDIFRSLVGDQGLAASEPERRQLRQGKRIAPRRLVDDDGARRPVYIGDRPDRA
jgi:hypothetical protein